METERESAGNVRVDSSMEMSCDEIPEDFCDDKSALSTIDESTLASIPRHLQTCLRCFVNKHGICTQINAMTALVISLSNECGFLGEWHAENFVIGSYALSWDCTIDRRLLMDSAKVHDAHKLNGDDTDHFQMRFFYSLAADKKITLHFVRSGDILIVSGRHQSIGDHITQTKSSAIPISRYVVRPKISAQNFPSNFRHLRELSMKLKNQIFVPLRDEIHQTIDRLRLYPSLLGIPDDVKLLIIRRYLKPKDKSSLSQTCKRFSKIRI